MIRYVAEFESFALNDEHKLRVGRMYFAFWDNPEIGGMCYQ